MQNLKEIGKLADTIGYFIEYWGFRKIHGRIWTVIYLADEPISTPEIVETLGVSKGLVSGAINELLGYKLIEPAEKVVHGAQTYIPAAEVGTVVRDVLATRESVLLAQAEEESKTLLGLQSQTLLAHNINPTRLRQLNSLIAANRGVLDKLVKKNFRSIGDWTRFVKNAIKFLRF